MWAGEQLACSVESGMDGSSEEWWKCLLVVEFQSRALESAYFGLRVVSLYDLASSWVKLVVGDYFVYWM